MIPVKKQLEILLIQYFRDCYSDFPKGKVVPSESPDFIVTLKSKNNLGIELTRLNPHNAKDPDQSEISQIHTRNKIIETALSLYEQSSALKLFVKFLFSEKHPVPPEKEISTAVTLANIIRKSTSSKHPDSFFRESLSFEQQKTGLKEILIVHHPDLKSHVWERSNNLGISENIFDDIRVAIHKKDEKLRLYQKQRLNYYWLVIITDRLLDIKRYNLSDKMMNNHFISRFQHVFLFDLIKSEVFQLV
jgi:hypothetical protein